MILISPLLLILTLYMPNVPSMRMGIDGMVVIRWMGIGEGGENWDGNGDGMRMGWNGIGWG